MITYLVSSFEIFIILREGFLHSKKMDTLSYKTVSIKTSLVKKDWFLIDATDMVLGRLAAKISHIIRGKHKTYFTPHVDCGDKIVVINAEKVKLTGKKWKQKQYIHHTGYPGGQKHTSAESLRKKKPEKLLELAVKGMLPKNKLGRTVYKNLIVYHGDHHPHAAQKPKLITI